MFGPNRICGVVAAPTAREMSRFLRLALRQTRTVELRLDYLENPRERAQFLSHMAKQKPRATLIATCRSVQGGGKFRGNAAVQLETLISAVRAGCQWCDIEVEAINGARGPRTAAELRRMLRPAQILLSYHDFRRTPRNLDALARRLDRFGADAVKIATECRSLQNAARLLRLARGHRNRVIVPMGESSHSARVLALREGSALAYAPVATPTAPGQSSLEDFARLAKGPRRLRGARELTRQTRVYAVIGDPIAHSLSPLMHNTAFALRHMDAIYLPFRVTKLQDFLAAVAPFSISGFSVTLPHKEEMLRRVHACDPLAREIGAVNTVVVRASGRLYGYNTDYVAVLRALESRMRLLRSRVLLLGAGGAARAAAFALTRAGAQVSIWSRTPQRAQNLARAAGAEGAIERAQIRRQHFDAIVNCTPVGLHPRGGSPLRAAELNCRIVMDMIYRPRETDFLRAARRRGIETISGVEMFVAQGVAQWELWTGRRAPEAAMRRAVYKALEREEGKRDAN